MEKRLIAAAAAVLCLLLVFCTGMARRNFEASLPHVQAQQIQTDSDGTILLPAAAIFRKPDGTACVWKLTSEPGAFGSERYWVKEVRISCTERKDGMIEVQGIYDLSAPYVTAATVPLADGMEVILDIYLEMYTSQYASVFTPNESPMVLASSEEFAIIGKNSERR